MDDAAFRSVDYQGALEFLFERINYERTDPVPYDSRRFKLVRMHELLDRLGSPHATLPCVHIAGTKGKGSTAILVASILREAGLRVGLYTSPHLNRLEERFTVSGRPCSESELIELVQLARPAIRQMDRAPDGESSPTYFEVTTALAFLHFQRHQVDFAVIETGLGGRLDSTNVCNPKVCAITTISMDHTRQLGHSLEQIAGEKAGIIKAGVPIVSGVSPPAAKVIRDVAREREAPLYELDVNFSYRRTSPPAHLLPEGDATFDYFEHPGDDRADLAALEPHWRDLPLRLWGDHQMANAAVALATCRRLEEQGVVLSESARDRGLRGARCPARVEVLSHRPVLVVDAAHNPASAAALARVIAEVPNIARRRLIFATSVDKDAREILRPLLPVFEELFLCRFLSNPRSRDPAELLELAESLRAESTRYPRVESVPDAQSAWSTVTGDLRDDDLVCASGSFFLAAEVRRLMQERGSAGC